MLLGIHQSDIIKRDTSDICQNIKQRGSGILQNQTQDILFQYVNRIHEIYGRELKAVILYGSYARGDYTESSDIDIMILVDSSEDTIKQKGRMVSDITFDFNLDHDILIMPIVKNINHFQYWLPADPFYKNVKNEGSNCMLPNSGNPSDLAMHRLMVAKEDLETAKDDFTGEHFRAAKAGTPASARLQ